MERGIFSYIFRYSKVEQIKLLLMVCVSFPFLYVSLDLPKIIINKAIGGKAFPAEFLGLSWDQLEYLGVLCTAFLLLIFINGGFKYYINVYRGVVGERMLRRLRYQLIERVMRFPLPQFRKVSQGEVVAMVTTETEPLGGFVGDSISLPAYQGGTLLTISLFMFIQDWVMGLAAISLYPVQAYLIPKLQAQVNLLGKERVRRVRALSERIGAVVQGAGEIHAHDTSRYELADFAGRQGGIYGVRVEIYRKKFFIKFLNNFLAQLTPFFFFSIGGYLVIKGDLSLGALVAILAAYKDMTAPWKELLTFYQRKEDARIKYEQLVEQFQPAGLMDEASQENEPETPVILVGELVANNVVLEEDEGTKVIAGASLVANLPQRMALVGPGGGGKEDMAKLLARQIVPTGGQIMIGGKNLLDLPETVTGRRMAYVGAEAYISSGTVRNNLLYSLKHRPKRPAEFPDEAAKSKREAEMVEAARAGNLDLDFQADWVDFEAAGCDGSDGLKERILQVLGLVELEGDIYQMGLRRTIDPAAFPALTENILKARSTLRKRLESPELAPLVETFDRARYNTSASVAENILFGTPVGNTFAIEQLGENPHVLKVLEDLDLIGDFLEKGRQLAEMMVELFQDLPPGHEYFERFSFINSDDLPEFQSILRRGASSGLDKINDADRARLLALPFKLIVARHRLELIDTAMQQRLLEARSKFHETLPESLQDAVQFFEPDLYNAASSIQDNILFGKVASDKAESAERVGSLIGDVIDELEMRGALIDAGFGFEVGVSGSRLSSAQRQKLAIARCLLKRPDVLVINGALSALDSMVQSNLFAAIQADMEDRTLIWVDGSSASTDNFDQIFTMESGRVAQQAGAAAQPAPVQTEGAAPEESSAEGEASGLAREVEVLAGIPLFAGLDRSKLKFLAFTSERVTYNAGQTIFRQGEVGDNAYIIVDGEVDVVLETPDGEKVIGHIGKNELFGELALLIDSPRTATIRTRADLTVLTISKELFVGLINEDAAISSNVVRAIARRFEGTMSEYSRAKVMYDSATALPTMSLFLDRYQQSVTQFKRVKRQAALVIFKIDAPELEQADSDSEIYQESFKEIVRRISACIRETDTLGLLDSMEFGIIMNEVDDENGPSFLADRIAGSLVDPISVGSEAISVKAPFNFKVRLCEADDLGVSVDNILELVRAKGEDITVGS